MPRVAAAKKMMKYKAAMTPAGIEQTAQRPKIPTPTQKSKRASRCESAAKLEKKGLLIEQWNLDFLKADLTWCGRNGSPTKVHRIQSVVLAAKETKIN